MSDPGPLFSLADCFWAVRTSGFKTGDLNNFKKSNEASTGEYNYGISSMDRRYRA